MSASASMASGAVPGPVPLGQPGFARAGLPPDWPDSLVFIERDWLSSNQLLGFDPEGATLIDSGYPKHAATTVALVREALAGRPLRRLLNTHLHSDHCGGNAAVVAAFGCPIDVPVAEAAAVAAWDEAALGFEGMGQHCPRFEAAGTLVPGEQRRLGGLDWEVLAAPGHHPRSVILYCRERRLLISADALWASGFGVIFPELYGESGFAEQAAVLSQIAELDVDWVIPGHGPVFSDVEGALVRAERRLAVMRADPAKHARASLKTLIKFMLLDREQIAWPELERLLREGATFQAIARLLGDEAQTEIVKRAVDELVGQGLARPADHGLQDANP